MNYMLQTLKYVRYVIKFLTHAVIHEGARLEIDRTYSLQTELVTAIINVSFWKTLDQAHNMFDHL